MAVSRARLSGKITTTAAIAMVYFVRGSMGLRVVVIG